jgi:excisionase family DNA binding protein
MSSKELIESVPRPISPGIPALTVVEASEYSKLPVRYLRRLIGEGRIAYHKVGRKVFLMRGDLDALFEAGRREASR